MADAPVPTCFLAMPFGRKASPANGGIFVDFDAIHRVMERGVEAAGLDCVRADYEPSGGFIHRAMFERLLLAEYVVADLTFANPNVTYEIGLRHGGSTGPTLLVAGRHPDFAPLPFDVAPLRVVPYDIDDDGTLADPDALAAELARRLEAARRGDAPPDNPLLQLTAIRPATTVEHEKTDTFILRTRYLGETGEAIADAVALPKSRRDEAVARLDGFADELLATGPDPVRQAYSLLLAIFLGYREHEAYGKMIELEKRMPRDLQQETVVREQFALALNRRAEAGEGEEAEHDRRLALRSLERIPEREWTSETFGILGRIHKGDWRRRAPDDPDRPAALDRAIDAYERGFRADTNDYYPGVNAVTLRVYRDGETRDDLIVLIHAVRYSVERARPADDPIERYWQQATKLELACAGLDWPTAERMLGTLFDSRVPGWPRASTAANLDDLASALANDAETAERIRGLADRLRPDPSN